MKCTKNYHQLIKNLFTPSFENLVEHLLTLRYAPYLTRGEMEDLAQIMTYIEMWYENDTNFPMAKAWSHLKHFNESQLREKKENLERRIEEDLEEEREERKALENEYRNLIGY